jgi:hypothetical protein
MGSPFVLSMMITGDSRSAVSAMTDAAVATTNLGRAGADAATKTKAVTDGLDQIEVAARSARDAVSANASVVDALRAKFDPAAAAAKTYAESLLDANAAHQAGIISGERLVAVQAELYAAYNRTANQMEAQAAASKRLAEQAVGAQTITPDRGADIAAYGRSLDALRGKYNPLYAAGETYKQTLEDIAKAERVGAISSDEAIAARNRATAAYRRQTEEIKKADREAAGEAGLNRTQRLMLFSAGKHGLESYASGAPLTTILSQQGLEVGDALQMGDNGAAGSLAAIGKIINPTTIGLGALAVAIGVATKAWWDYDAAQRQLTVSASGVGRGVGATVDELNQISARAAAAGNISVSSARGLENQLLRTGKVGLSSFEGIIAISKDFGATVGLDADKAGEALTSIFADPAKGAQTLYQQYNLIDGQTVRQVERLVEQNRLQEAQQEILKALPAHLVKASEATDVWLRGLNAVKLTLQGIYEGIGATIANAGKKGSSSISGDPISEGLGNLFVSPPPADPMEEASKQFYGNEDKAKAERDRIEAERKKAVDFGTGIAAKSPAIAEAEAKRQLDEEVEGLRKAQTSAVDLNGGRAPASGLAGEEYQKRAVALDAATRAQTTWISEQERANQLAQVDVQLAQARDPITRADLEAQRVRIQLGGQKVETSKAEASAEEARTRSLQLSLAQSSVQIATLNDEVAARRRINDAVAAGTMSQADANRELQIEQATRPLVIAATKAEGAEKERLLSIIRGITDATRAQGEEEKRAQAQQAIKSGTDQLEMTRAEISLLGQSEAVRNRQLALLKAEQDIRQRGLDTSSREANALRQTAAAQADANTQLSRMKDAYGELNSAEEKSIDDVFDGLTKGKDVFASVTQDIQSAALKLAVTNPLKNALLGTNYGTFADLGAKPGTIANGLAQSVGTATINAATVIINGGVGAGSAVAAAAGIPANSNGPVNASPDAYVNRLFKIESGGDPNNKTGSNYGLAQFSYADMKGLGFSNPLDPAQARGATLAEMNRNAAPLAALLGRGATPGEFYLAHQQGLAGASDLLKNPDMPAWQAIRGRYGSDAIAQQAITGNGGTLDMTSKQFSDMWVQKFENGMDRASTSATSLASAGDKAATATTTLGTNFTDLSKNVLSTDAPPMSALQASSGATGATGAVGGIGGLFNGLFSAIGSIMSSLTSAIGGLFSGAGGGIGSIFSAIFGGGFAGGGKLSGPGTGTSDSFLIAASNGEFMVNAEATAKHLPLLQAINDNKVPRFASGGFVGNRASLPAANSNASSGAPQPVFQTVINNNTSAQVTQRETDDGRGGRRQEIMIDEMVGSSLSRQGGASQKALQQTFGVRSQAVRR